MIYLSVVILSIGLGGYLLFIKGRSLEFQAGGLQQAIYQDNIAHKQRIVLHWQKQKFELVPLETELKQIIKQFMPFEALPNLLENLSKLGRSSGLEVLSFVPERLKTHQFYKELFISMRVRGHYEQLQDFLEQLLGLKGKLKLLAFTMSSSQTSDALTNTLEMSLKAKIFSYRDFESHHA